MSEKGSEKAGKKQRDRDERGRLVKGTTVGRENAWGPDNPPPKSPGRPKKDAWITALKAKLEDSPGLANELAAKLLEHALEGSEKGSLRALDMIEDRIGGPVVRKIEAEIDGSGGVLVVPAKMTPDEWIADAMERNQQAEAPES